MEKVNEKSQNKNQEEVYTSTDKKDCKKEEKQKNDEKQMSERDKEIADIKSGKQAYIIMIVIDLLASAFCLLLLLSRVAIAIGFLGLLFCIMMLIYLISGMQQETKKEHMIYSRGYDYYKKHTTFVNCPQCASQNRCDVEYCAYCGHELFKKDCKSNPLQKDEKRYYIVLVQLGSLRNKDYVRAKIIKKTHVSISEATNMVDNIPSILAYNINLGVAKNIQYDLSSDRAITVIEECDDNIDINKLSKEELSEFLGKYKIKRTCPNCGSASITAIKTLEYNKIGWHDELNIIERCDKCHHTWKN